MINGVAANNVVSDVYNLSENADNKAKKASLPERIKNGDKKLIGSLVGLAAVAVAGAAVAHGKKNKPLKLSLNDVNIKGKFATVSSENKKIKAKNGTPLTGVVSYKTNEGAKITTEYKDGLMVKSQRKGKNSFVKEYVYDENKNITSVIKDGKEKDIVKMKQKALARKQQRKVFENIFDNLNKLKEQLLKTVDAVIGE